MHIKANPPLTLLLSLLLFAAKIQKELSVFTISIFSVRLIPHLTPLSPSTHFSTGIAFLEVLLTAMLPKQVGLSILIVALLDFLTG